MSIHNGPVVLFLAIHKLQPLALASLVLFAWLGLDYLCHYTTVKANKSIKASGV